MWRSLNPCCQASQIIPYDSRDEQNGDVNRLNIRTKPAAKYSLQASSSGNVDTKSPHDQQIYLYGSRDPALVDEDLQGVDWVSELEGLDKCVEVDLQTRGVFCEVESEMDKLIHCSSKSEKTHIFIHYRGTQGMKSRLQRILFKDPTKTSEIHLVQYTHLLKSITTMILFSDKKHEHQVVIPQLAVVYSILFSCGLSEVLVTLPLPCAGVLEQAARILLASTTKLQNAWSSLDPRLQRLWSCSFLQILLMIERLPTGDELTSIVQNTLIELQTAYRGMHRNLGFVSSYDGFDENGTSLAVIGSSLPLWILLGRLHKGISMKDHEHQAVMTMGRLLRAMQDCHVAPASPSRMRQAEQVAMTLDSLLHGLFRDKSGNHYPSGEARKEGRDIAVLEVAVASVIVFLDHLLLLTLEIHDERDENNSSHGAVERIHEHNSGTGGGEIKCGSGMLSFRQLQILFSRTCALALILHVRVVRPSLDTQNTRSWTGVSKLWLMLSMKVQQSATVLSFFAKSRGSVDPASSVARPSKVPVPAPVPTLPLLLEGDKEQVGEEWKVGDKAEAQCVLSNGSQRWFGGSLKALDAANGRATITFQDGEVKSISLSELRVPKAELLRRKKEARKLGVTAPFRTSATATTPVAVHRNAGLSSPEDPGVSGRTSPPTTPDALSLPEPVLSCSPDLRKKKSRNAVGEEASASDLGNAEGGPRRKWDGPKLSLSTECSETADGLVDEQGKKGMEADYDDDDNDGDNDDDDDDGSVLEIPAVFDGEDEGKQELMRKSFSDSGLVPSILMRSVSGGSAGGGVMSSHSLAGGSFSGSSRVSPALGLPPSEGASSGPTSLSHMSRSVSPFSSSLVVAEDSMGAWGDASASFDAFLSGEKAQVMLLAPSYQANAKREALLVCIGEACALLAAVATCPADGSLDLEMSLPQVVEGRLLTCDAAPSEDTAGDTTSPRLAVRLPILAMDVESSSDRDVDTSSVGSWPFSARVNVLFCLRGALEVLENVSPASVCFPTDSLLECPSGTEKNRHPCDKLSVHLSSLKNRLQSLSEDGAQCTSRVHFGAAASLTRLCTGSAVPESGLPCLAAHMNAVNGFSALRFLGKGGFSSVHALVCRCREQAKEENSEKGLESTTQHMQGKAFAIKCMKRENSASEPMPPLVDAFNEVRCLQQLSLKCVPGVVALRGFGAITSTSLSSSSSSFSSSSMTPVNRDFSSLTPSSTQSSEYYMLLELGGPSLAAWRSELSWKDVCLAAKGSESPPERWILLLFMEIYWDICLVMSSVHACGVLHFDIKCANFLLARLSTLENLMTPEEKSEFRQACADSHSDGVTETLSTLLALRQLWPYIRRCHVQGRPSGCFLLCDFGEAMFANPLAPQSCINKAHSKDNLESNNVLKQGRLQIEAPPALLSRARGTLPIQAPEFVALSVGNNGSSNATYRSTGSHTGRSNTSSARGHSHRIPIAFPSSYPDAKADVWSLGCLLPELLMGKMLLEGRVWSELYVHLCTENPRTTGVMYNQPPSPSPGTGTANSHVPAPAPAPVVSSYKDQSDFLSWPNSPSEDMISSAESNKSEDATAVLAAHYKRPLHSIVALFCGKLPLFMRSPGDENQLNEAPAEDFTGKDCKNEDILQLVRVLINASLQRRPEERQELADMRNHLNNLAHLPSSETP